MRISTKLRFCFILSLYIPNSLAQQLSKNKWQISSYTGYQWSDFRWSIAGNEAGGNPNVLSELIWEGLGGPQFGLSLDYGLNDRMNLKARGTYMKINKGKVSDTDYSDDNRLGIYYYDVFPSNHGSDVNADLVLSYVLFQTKGMQLRPLIGLGLRKSTLYLLEDSNVAESEGLRSSYKSTWRGLKLGAELGLDLGKLDVECRLLGSLLDYGAKANWNLIPAFAKPVSFRHGATAYMVEGEFQFEYLIFSGWSVLLEAGTYFAQTWEGTDEAYYVEQAPKRTQFNGARGHAYRIGGGLKYTFFRK